MSCFVKLTLWCRINRLYRTPERTFHRLKNRGLIKQIFPPLEDGQLSTVLKQSPAAYCGFDPTSDSLHLGNLLSIVLLIQLQRKGIIPIALIGEATAQIGDPSGRSTEREEIASKSIEVNARGIEDNIKTVFSNYQRFFDNSSQLPELVMVRNSSWYSGLEIVKFLGTIGRHFRLGQMLGRESVKVRLASSEGISMSEFSYQMFQAYDWLQLYSQYKCLIQIGGQDQLGNIDAGRELIRRVHGVSAQGLLTPLITSESGDKYGKSAGNAIWLSAKKTSPYEVYQFLLRMSDTEAEKIVPFFSFAEDDELAELIQQHQIHPENRSLQTRIATDITMLLHGPNELSLAQKATDLLFNGKWELLDQLDESNLRRIFVGTTYMELPKQKLLNRFDLVDFSLEAKLFETKEDAKRIISAGGLYVNMQRTQTSLLSESCVLPSGLTLTRVGKKNYTLIKWI